MSETRKNPYNVQGISFESEALLNDAKKRARSFGLSLSNYVCQLVKNDIDDNSSVIVRPRQDPEDKPIPYGNALNEPQDIAAEKLGRRAVNELPAEPAKPPTPQPADAGSGLERSGRKIVGKLKRDVARMIREKHGK